MWADETSAAPGHQPWTNTFSLEASWFTDPVWVGLAVGGGSEFSRQRVHHSRVALRADNASSGTSDDVTAAIEANPTIGQFTHAGRRVVGPSGGVGREDLVPTKSSDNDILFQGIRGSKFAWYAFDDSHQDGTPETIQRFWGSVANPSYPQWYGYGFGAGNEQIVKGYTMRARQDHCCNASPKTWELQGSQDGSSWDSLHGASFDSWATSGINNLREYTVTNTTAYRYYRIYITTNGGHTDVNIGQLELLGDAVTPADLVLQSTPATAASAPTSADLVVLIDDGLGTAVVGTDIPAATKSTRVLGVSLTWR